MSKEEMHALRKELHKVGSIQSKLVDLLTSQHDQNEFQLKLLKEIRDELRAWNESRKQRQKERDGHAKPTKRRIG